MCNTDCREVFEVLAHRIDVTSYWQRELITEIRGLVTRDWRVEFLYVDRDRNQVADALAKEAVRMDLPRRLWLKPPSFIISKQTK
ncbi:hypothetical protein OROGR_015988 [Orobanche gracilis]